MQKQTSYDPFFEQLLSLARIYSPSAQAVPEGSRQYWIDVISGQTPKALKAVLSDWARENTRMMMPADLAKKLADYRSDKIEKQAKAVAKDDHAPLPENVAEIYWSINDRIQARLSKVPNHPTLWARRLRILEAYGFQVFPIAAKAWRKVLGYPETYRFEDMKSLPYHTGKGYAPRDEGAMEATNPSLKFIFLYEHEYPLGELVEGAEWLFELMDEVTGDWRNYYDEKEPVAA